MAEEPPVKRQRALTFDLRDVDVADYWLRRIETTNASGHGCQCMFRVDPVTNRNVNCTFRQCTRCDAQENDLNEQYDSYYENNGSMSKLSSSV